jgi:hypothetical protein
MSFMEKARLAAEQARQKALESATRAQDAIHDPSTAARARDVFVRARKGVSTAIDRIDPSVLADVIVKATALQERANDALRAKGSPYRISEIAIGAAIPPSVTFSIARESDPDVPGGAVDSVDLVAAEEVDTEAVRALDGSVVEDAGEPEAAAD